MTHLLPPYRQRLRDTTLQHLWRTGQRLPLHDLERPITGSVSCVGGATLPSGTSAAAASPHTARRSHPASAASRSPSAPTRDEVSRRAYARSETSTDDASGRATMYATPMLRA